MLNDWVVSHVKEEVTEVDEQRGERAWAGWGLTLASGRDADPDRVTLGADRDAATLASDADRDAAGRRLGVAFAEGRLDADEHGERVRAAYAARTWQDLDRLTADLPKPATQAAVAAPRALDTGSLERCLICALLICCPPAGIIWLLMAWRKSRSVQGLQPSDVGVPGRGGAGAEDH
jgi:hypothetical protein